MIKIFDCIQQTPEWYEVKKQNPFSSSNATAIGNQGAGLETLVWEAIANEMSSGKEESFTNKHIERGNELEPLARASYELATGFSIQEVGFITNDKYERAGASTDSLVNEDGVLEIKAFEDKKYIKLLHEWKKTKTFKIESGYEWQVQFELLITERAWCEFVIYNPNFEEDMLIKRVYPDAVMQQKLITGIALGNKLYKEIKEVLNNGKRV